MVVVKLSGGAGNQMFQYSMGRALSLRQGGTKLVLDPSELMDSMPRRGAYKHHYSLENIFELRPHLTMTAALFRKVKVPYVAAVIAKFGPSFFGKIGRWQYVFDSTFLFKPEIAALKGDVYLLGSWQTEKYFADYAHVIRKDFTFRHPLADASRSLRDDILNSASVALHVRRGDKVWNPVARNFTVLATQEYYDAALAHIKNKIGSNIKVFVFSDDIDWCRENLTIDAEHVYVGEEHAGISAGGHLQLMSLCKHFIIPESTFSWWGAWLSKNENKIVVAPKSMFQDKNIDTRDTHPSSWIRI